MDDLFTLGRRSEKNMKFIDITGLVCVISFQKDIACTVFEIIQLNDAILQDDIDIARVYSNHLP
jgi:hypothetical protein